MWENGLNMWEMAYICGKRLNFVGNDLDLLEADQICDSWLSCVGNG